MRSGTKLKQLLWDNTITMSLNKIGEIDMMLVNNDTGDAHMVTGTSFSQTVGRAYIDSAKIKRNDRKQVLAEIAEASKLVNII